MKYIKKFNETIAYHGKKNNIMLDMEDIGKRSTYFYLTTNYGYALEYSNGKSKDSVFKFDIDESKLLDLRLLGMKKYKFGDLRKKFNDLTKLFWPLQFQQLYSWTRRVDDMALWEWIRHDTDGIIRKIIEKAGYDGILLQEERFDRGFESIALFNAEPIKNKKAIFN